MSDERTIEATPRRREQARREGRFPRSRELAIGALLLAVLTVLHFCGDNWLAQGTDSLREHLTRPVSLHTDADRWIAAGRRGLAVTCYALLPWLAASAAAIVVAQLLQGGLVWLPAKICPDLSRLCRRSGSSAASQAIQALFGVLSFCAGITILFVGLWTLREPLWENGCRDLPEALTTSASLVGKLILPVLAACVALCGLEYGYRLKSYYASLRMSPTEFREEAAGRTSIRVFRAAGGTERRREWDPQGAQEIKAEPDR